jgi:hypothetical protein
VCHCEQAVSGSSPEHWSSVLSTRFESNPAPGHHGRLEHSARGLSQCRPSSRSLPIPHLLCRRSSNRGQGPSPRVRVGRTFPCSPHSEAGVRRRDRPSPLHTCMAPLPQLRRAEGGRTAGTQGEAVRRWLQACSTRPMRHRPPRMAQRSAIRPPTLCSARQPSRPTCCRAPSPAPRVPRARCSRCGATGDGHAPGTSTHHDPLHCTIEGDTKGHVVTSGLTWKGGEFARALPP